MSTPTPHEAAEAHAAACRAVLTAGELRPRYAGPSLARADLTGANLTGAILIGAILRGANLRNTHITGVNLSGADLRGAHITGVNLSGADLRGANLRGADLRDADLRDADLSGATVAEGTVAAAVSGAAGGYRWHALALVKGGVVLQYGCDRAPLAKWQTRGPAYGERYHHGSEHWDTGPAVAIAAAEALVASITAPVGL